MNKVIVMGNITRDVELRSVGSGTQVAQIGIAVNRKWKSADGEAREDVAFIDCEAWGKTAEVIAKFFGKGKRILLEGRIAQDTWDDKATGAKRSKLKIVVESFDFVDGKADAQPEPARTVPKPNRTPFKQPGTEMLPDDPPF